MTRNTPAKALLAGLLTALSLPACGTDGDALCAQNAKTEYAEAPQITGFSFVEHLNGDPWTLIFSASFADIDGDLGQLGKAEIFLNGKGPPERIELQELFSQSAVAIDATEGTLAIPLRFGESIKSGTEVQLGLQFLDANSFRSNCYSIELMFDVSDAP